MVAVIKSGKSIRGVFLYNENKVSEGVASGLMAMNYPMEFEEMTPDMRLKMLLKRIELNTAVTRNSMHISLNFAPEEQHSEYFLKVLIAEYMDRIGFGSQPYLAYQHFDSGHPHVHIVTTTIKQDGRRIETQNIGKNISEPARKEMETKYNLVKAEDHKMELFQPKPINAAVVSYGKVSTKRAISSILSSVLNSYKYTSLPELNALLGLYNVTAQRGDEHSRMYQNRGLAYRVIDKNGKSLSTPINASAFHQKALLKDIENRFIKNDVERQKYKSRVKVAMDWNLRPKDITIEKLCEKLKAEGITTVLRKNASGDLYGITFIDHKTKCIFNGSDIGKQYSAAAITERCSHIENDKLQPVIDSAKNQSDKETMDDNTLTVNASKTQTDAVIADFSKDDKGLLEELMQSEYSNIYLPFELRKNPKKKKRKKSNRL